MALQKNRKTRDAMEEFARSARDKADKEARRIPWQLLLSTQSLYIDWTEFRCWVCCLSESAGHIPEVARGELQARCPGFLEAEADYQNGKIGGERTFYMRLYAWIQDHFFATQEQEGWLDAVTWYASRDPRYLRAHSHLSECKERWALAQPISYPSFEQWREDALRSPVERTLRRKLQARWAAFNRVGSKCLEESLASYLEWEAFAYWCLLPLDHAGEVLGASDSPPSLEQFSSVLPPIVSAELKRRCPGFLEYEAQFCRKGAPIYPGPWVRLMEWIKANFFATEKSKNWLDAVLIAAEHHPRGRRAVDYWMAWDEKWNRDDLAQYPSFEEWRAAADSFVDLSVDED